MRAKFSLPEGALGRFAVVKLWPELKAAEDENIARLKLAAKAIGVECIEILADGTLLSSPQQKISKDSVDFVLHLHYDTPKLYDAFSFVALWNPLRFYHIWGYARCSRNLTTHDDFVSCSSAPADDHVARMVRKSYTHLPPRFHLYHSPADIIHPPSLGDGKLFYVGINWEVVTGGESRHQEVLKRLDKTGLMRIYGPEIFQNVRVWAGYDSYVREIPFDGISMIDEISKAGVALVLSSEPHKESELMSNRLFESVAAGALVICDENPFAKRYFGDSLLYIDSRASVEQTFTDILSHLKWARSNPGQALAAIAKSQEIFRGKFSLIRNLSDLYCGLSERKRDLRCRQNAPESPAVKVRVDLLMPEYSESVLQAHIRSVRVQDYPHFSPVLVIDRQAATGIRGQIETALATCPKKIAMMEIEFFNFGIHPEIKCRRRMGEIIGDLLKETGGADAFMVVAPNEALFSNHVAVLAGALQRDPRVNCAATAAILLNGDAPIHDVYERIDFGLDDRKKPTGYGRFVFRFSAIPKDIGIALRHLDRQPLAVVVDGHAIEQQFPASITIDLQQEFSEHKWDQAVEREIVRDYNPAALRAFLGLGPQASGGVPLAVSTMSKRQLVRKLFNRRWIKKQIQALRNEGLSARIEMFKKKLGFL